MRLVTCIVTCYEKIDYLYEAIKSVLEQDYPNLELLVTDDGSKEFPKNRIEKFIYDNKRENIKRFIVFHHNQNVGTVKNLNNMLKKARGDYFIGLDGDDVFYDNTVVSRIVQRFEETGVDFLSCARMLCDIELKEKEQLPNLKEKKIINTLDTAKKQFKSFATLKFYNMVSGSAMYFTRNSLKEMGLFDESYRQFQDGPRIIEYVRRGKMIPTAFDIISVKYRSGGVSNKPESNLESAKYLNDDREHYIEQYLIPNRFQIHGKWKRNVLFWYYMEHHSTVKERIVLITMYPDKLLQVLLMRLKKLLNNC